MLRVIGSIIPVLLVIASTAYGSVPPMEVTVFDASGKVAFKGPMSAKATFATPKLYPGNYVVQFNAKTAVVKGNQYLFVVSTGKKKVIAAGVPGEMLAVGGAAMKVDVAAGSKITGQVAPQQAVALERRFKYRVIDGQRYVWMTDELGSNLGGRWVEEGLSPARNVIHWDQDELRKMQDRPVGNNDGRSGHHGL